jgi:hypothetical protein
MRDVKTASTVFGLAVATAMAVGGCASSRRVGMSASGAPAAEEATGKAAAPPPANTVHTGSFHHPGILATAQQLDFVKTKIAGGAEPWSAAFKTVQASPLGQLSYKATPFASVDCGRSSNNPRNGCKEEQTDVQAAYTHALIWYFTRNEAHAQKAIEIMDAWSAVLKTHTASNAPPQSGWTGAVFPRAAEIIRHTYGKWPADRVARFATMLKTAYLPITLKGARDPFGSKQLVPNGNWEAVMIEASVGIAVFTDDRVAFDRAIAMWRERLPSYMYMKSDGALPVSPPLQPNATPYTAEQIHEYWGGQTEFNADGMGQEMCRDAHHLEYGYAAMANVAETARIQGIDLYGPQKQRIVAAYEFATQFLAGDPIPSWLCGGKLDLKGAIHNWEIGYNHFANRLGIPMPNTKRYIAKIRPTDANHHMIWETLTHAEVGGAGL